MMTGKSFQFSQVNSQGVTLIRVDNAADIRVAMAAARRSGLNISHGRGVVSGFQPDVIIDAEAV